MNWPHSRWLLAGALLLLAFLAGCAGREKLPSIEDTLPASFEEKAVPPDFVRSMASSIGRDTGWIRCIDCDLDWPGLSRHVCGALSGQGYSDTTAQWMPVMTGQSGIPDEHARQIFKIYSSTSGFCHVMLINLEYMRSIPGASVATTGDFLVMVGYDDIEQYR